MRTNLKHAAPVWTLLCAVPALAHDGHALEGVTHWHLADAVGLLAGVVGVAVLAFLARRKRDR